MFTFRWTPDKQTEDNAFPKLQVQLAELLTKLNSTDTLFAFFDS